MACCCNGRTSSILADLFGPEFIAHRNMGGAYRRYPVGARVGMGVATTLSGMVKPLLLPLIAALGLLLMPIMAGRASHRGDVEGTKGYLQAWGVCALVLAGTVAFLSLTAYHMSLAHSSALIVGVVALSTIFHVRKSMSEPAHLI